MHIMQKMQAKSVIDLARMADKLSAAASTQKLSTPKPKA